MAETPAQRRAREANALKGKQADAAAKEADARRAAAESAARVEAERAAIERARIEAETAAAARAAEERRQGAERADRTERERVEREDRLRREELSRADKQRQSDLIQSTAKFTIGGIAAGAAMAAIAAVVARRAGAPVAAQLNKLGNQAQRLMKQSPAMATTRVLGDELRGTVEAATKLAGPIPFADVGRVPKIATNFAYGEMVVGAGSLGASFVVEDQDVATALRVAGATSLGMGVGQKLGYTVASMSSNGLTARALSGLQSASVRIAREQASGARAVIAGRDAVARAKSATAGRLAALEGRLVEGNALALARRSERAAARVVAARRQPDHSPKAKSVAAARPARGPATYTRTYTKGPKAGMSETVKNTRRAA